MTSSFVRRCHAVAVALTVLAATACSSATADTEADGIPDQVEGIPDVVLTAYQQAAAATPDIAPDCTGMKWSILAGIGQEESHHGTLDGSEVDQEGQVSPPIIGPALNGDGFAEISDTDNGHYDNDTTWDRAVGPMQFIPETWEAWAVDSNGDGQADPQNVFDATATAAAYLCGQGEVDLSDEDTLRSRLRVYNNSDAYVNDVIGHIEAYDALPTDEEAPAAAAGSVQEVGEQTPCANLQLHPDACHAHEALHEVFGGFYLSAGGQRHEPGSDHHTGEAIDYMMAPLGQHPTEQMHAQALVVVQYAIDNYEALRVKGIIYEERIWNPDRDETSGAWTQVSRPATPYNDITLDHYDHIHLAAGPGPMR